VTRLHIRGFVVALALLGAHGAYAAAPADLRIRTTMKSFHAGGVGTYNIIVSNRGPSATDGAITITDLLPTGLSFVSGSGQGWTCGSSGALVTCTNPGPLSAPSISLLQLTIGADNHAVGVAVNSITVSYAGDPNQANNTVTKSTVIKSARGPLPTTTATPTPATPVPTSAGATQTPTATGTPVVAAATDLSMMNSNHGAFTVGVNGVYTLVVTNAGSAATNTTITVVDQLPNGLGFVSGTGTGWTCGASGQTVTCTNSAALAPGANTAITLTVSVGSAAFPTVTNVATVSYPGDTNSADDTKFRPTTVRAG
jgi:uncharacterized repeat protein (TIGR01451 family)